MHPSFQLNGISFASEKELLIFSKTISENLHDFLSDWFTKKAYIIVKTSGSTGIPKLIQLKKEYMKNSALATGEFFNVKENTKALLCLSIDYIAGKMMLIRALTLGWKLDIVDPISNPLIHTNKIYDFSAMIPLQLQNSLGEIHRIKKLIIGGGVVSNKLINRLKDITSEVFATYGMTETSTHIAIKKLNHYENAISNQTEKSFYKALPEVTIYKDQRNCLVIDAPKVTDELIVTNDIVQLISENEFEWLGRFDNAINSGGIKLYPEKIEEKLSTIISNRFFVTGISDEVLGEKLILIVEGDDIPNKTNKLASEIIQIKSLTKYEIPKEIYFVKKFIQTDTKKIQRKKTTTLIYKE